MNINKYIYRKNTTVFISSILAIYYNRHNYMFRPLMLAIFRLYMDTAIKHVWVFLGCGERGSFVGPRSRLCQWWVHGLEQYHSCVLPIYIHILH